jgi:hypothetical protein
VVAAPPPKPGAPLPSAPRRSIGPTVALIGALLSPVAATVGAELHLRSLEAKVADTAAALDVPWRAHGPVSTLVAHAEVYAPVADAVASMSASASPEARLTAARQLHGAVERELLRQAVDANDADARARARATEADLATAARLLDEAASAALDHSMAEGSVWGALATPARRMLGARAPTPLRAPTLGAFSAAEPRVAKKGR